MFKTGHMKAIFLWGVICLLGFGVWQFWQPADYFGMIHYAWIALVVIGTVGMIVWIPNILKHRIFRAWTAVNVVGMLVSIGTWMGIVPLFALGINYGAFWALIMAAGFAYTTTRMKGSIGYPVAAVLCVLVAGAIYLKMAPLMGLNWAFVPLGIASGAPLLYEGMFGKPG
ncbi:MAG: hypothetical protein HY917_04860 [Candidatus Diapherotrites archaeon]|nr:hypothetical protein [Candidatus Diapherotrites archaeon]